MLCKRGQKEAGAAKREIEDIRFEDGIMMTSYSSATPRHDVLEESPSHSRNKASMRELTEFDVITWNKISHRDRRLLVIIRAVSFAFARLKKMKASVPNAPN